MLGNTMTPFPSSNQHNKHGHGAAGRTLLWLAIILSVALLAFVTLLAIRNNPLYSNTEANGISKYKFIEFCKDELSNKLNDFAKQPGGGAIGASYNARDIVSSVTEGILQRPAAKATTPPPRLPGWAMVSQVKLSRDGYPAQTVPFGCQYEKGKPVQLQFPLQQQQ